MARLILTYLTTSFAIFSFCYSSAGFAKPPPYKIGLALWTGYPDSVQGFKDGLAENGINLSTDVTFVSGVISSDKSAQRAAAKTLAEQKVDLVYSLTTPGTVIVKETLPATTPIVFSIVTYPADSGLIDSFEYSGNNLVGTSNYVPLQHHITLISKLVPTTKYVAIFHRKGEPNSKIQATNLVRLLKRKGINATDVEAQDIDEFKTKANTLPSNIDLYITTTDTLLQNGGEAALIQIAEQKNIPILSSNKAGIMQGSTFGPVADFYKLGKISGKKAAEILRNDQQPSQLQSNLQDQPTFLINRASARRLGIEIDDTNSNQYQWH